MEGKELTTRILFDLKSFLGNIIAGTDENDPHKADDKKRLSDVNKALEWLNSYEKLKKDSDFEVNRVYEWLMDENREPANTKFTAGPTRNLAREIEYRIKHSQFNSDEYLDSLDQVKKERDELREMLDKYYNQPYLEYKELERVRELLNKPQ